MWLSPHMHSMLIMRAPVSRDVAMIWSIWESVSLSGSKKSSSGITTPS